MAKARKKSPSVVPPIPKPDVVTIDNAELRDIARLLDDSDVSESDVYKVLHVLKAQEVRAATITTVLELTNLIVKNKYEANSDTNALTDALLTKLNSIEASATADQTAAEIAAAYASEVGPASQAEAEAGTETDLRTWSPLRIAQAIAALSSGGGGGGVSTGQFDLASGNVAARGEYIGTTAPTISSPATGEYVITVPAGTRIISITVFGNNTTLTGSSEFELSVDNSANGLHRSYTVAQYIAATGAAADRFSLGTVETETFPATDVTKLLFPNMSGYGAAGFRLVLA